MLERLELPYTPLWPVLFLASILVLTLGAAVWDRHDGNRLLTVGIVSIMQRDAGRRLTAAARRVVVNVIHSQSVSPVAEANRR